jgi:hypothetical protein
MWGINVSNREEELAEKSKKVFINLLKIMLPIIICFSFVISMIPSTKQVAFIYIVGTMSQNKIVQDIGEKSLQIPDKALEMLNIKMDEYLKEMKGEIKEAVKK